MFECDLDISPRVALWGTQGQMGLSTSEGGIVTGDALIKANYVINECSR